MVEHGDGKSITLLVYSKKNCRERMINGYRRWGQGDNREWRGLWPSTEAGPKGTAVTQLQGTVAMWECGPREARLSDFLQSQKQDFSVNSPDF